MATTTLTHAPTQAQPQHRTAAPEHSGAGTQQAPPPPPPLTHRAPALDGLRTLAILVVVLYHLHVPQFEGGFIGVTVFFVLSGFLITTLLLGERRRTGRVRLGTFWVKRLLRLYPALLALVVVGLLLWNWVGDYKGASLQSGEAAFIALTYTGNLFRAFWDTSQGVFAHTWSLSMEEQFYLVWPPVLVLLAVLRVRRRWLLAGLGVLVVGASAASWASYRSPSGGATPDVYFSPVLGVVPLAIGCGLALLLDDERVRVRAAGVLGHVATWLGLLLLVGVLLGIDDDWTQHASTFGIVLPLTGVIAAVTIGGLVSVRSPRVRRPGLDAGVVVRPPGVVLGVPLAPAGDRAARHLRDRPLGHGRPGRRGGDRVDRRRLRRRGARRAVPRTGPCGSRCRSARDPARVRARARARAAHRVSRRCRVRPADPTSSAH
ncbi:acyltransferase [Curtobacterium flaccumfaciens pv. flaccumfaciens]